uniref:Uncharacterized protein n=1 Tax=Panagrolaimus davidi TaxID=227884 RepID=A0A914PXP1_9BILA
MSLDRILDSIDHLLSNLDKSVNDLLWHAKLFIPILAISMALLVIVLISMCITQIYISRKKSEKYRLLEIRNSQDHYIDTEITKQPQPEYTVPEYFQPKRDL